MNVLTINCGSSSLKYARFRGEQEIARGVVDRIGSGGPADHGAAVSALLDRMADDPIDAVGHRLVHGGPEHIEPTCVDDALLASLARAVPFAPLHLPAELRAVEAARARLGVPQVVCFDTTFHRTMPEVAKRFPLPNALFEEGIRRYGFHGLSYEYVVQTLGAKKLGRAIIAHLGNGASMVAVRDGQSIETTMGFTPTAGLVMGTRSGDLDPGLIVHLVRSKGYDAAKLERLVDHEAGLHALSGGTSDMRTLLETRATDPRAELAISVFCYQARKWIGALAAVLGGLDTLVFTGGIGEHAAEIRSEICAGLEFLGITGEDSAPCATRVIRTDEERMIARHTSRLTAPIVGSSPPAVTSRG